MQVHRILVAAAGKFFLFKMVANDIKPKGKLQKYIFNKKKKKICSF